MKDFSARVLVGGEATGLLAVWSTPLSFWGGFDVSTGRVIDRSHPAFGQEATGRILAMPSGRGSSSASSVLAEAIRLGTAPAAIFLTAPDPIITVGAIVARKLYGKTCPILVCELPDFQSLVDGQRVRVVAREGACWIEAISG
jgi:predicted aconitase with swiveling domain